MLIAPSSLRWAAPLRGQHPIFSFHQHLPAPVPFHIPDLSKAHTWNSLLDSGSHLQSTVPSATQEEQEEEGALNENPTNLLSDLFKVFFNSTDANKLFILSEVKVLTAMQYKHWPWSGTQWCPTFCTLCWEDRKDHPFLPPSPMMWAFWRSLLAPSPFLGLSTPPPRVSHSPLDFNCPSLMTDQRHPPQESRLPPERLDSCSDEQ